MLLTTLCTISKGDLLTFTATEFAGIKLCVTGLTWGLLFDNVGGVFIETVAVLALPANTEVIVLLPTVLPLAIVVTTPVLILLILEI